MACDLGGPTGNVLPDVPGLQVERGTLEETLALTGEVDAAHAVHLSGPRTDDWNLAIRWLAEEGAHVTAGDRVVGFDNVAVTGRLRDLEIAVIEAGNALAEFEAKSEVELADKQFEVEKQRAAVAKAELDARVPADLLARREAQNHRLDLARAKTAFATAIGDLEAMRTAQSLEAEVKHIAEAKAMRQLEAAREQLAAMDLYAPRDGRVIIADHPWEGRRLQVGDNVWPGMTIVRLPDLSEVVVRARLDDVDDGRVMPGMAARCIVDAFPERPITGHVVELSPVAHELAKESTRRYFTVNIALDEAAPEVLRPGLSVRVEVITRPAGEALLVPRAALDLSRAPARVRRADGSWAEVELDGCDPLRCSASAGVAEGEPLALAQEAP